MEEPSEEILAVVGVLTTLNDLSEHLKK